MCRINRLAAPLHHTDPLPLLIYSPQMLPVMRHEVVSEGLAIDYRGPISRTPKLLFGPSRTLSYPDIWF